MNYNKARINILEGVDYSKCIINSEGKITHGHGKGSGIPGPLPDMERRSITDEIKRHLKYGSTEEQLGNLTYKLRKINRYDLKKIARDTEHTDKDDLLDKIQKAQISKQPKLSIKTNGLPSDNELANAKHEPFEGTDSQHEFVGGLGKVIVNGKKYFYKSFDPGDNPGGEVGSIHNELAISKIASLCGIDVPNSKGYKRKGLDTLLQEWTKGKTLGSLESKPNIHQDVVEKHLLFTYMCAVGDRHLGNYMVNGDKLVSIDHEYAFNTPEIKHDNGRDKSNHEQGAECLIGNKLKNLLPTEDHTFNPTVVKSLVESAPKVLEELNSSGMESQAKGVSERVEVLRKLLSSGKINYNKLVKSGH